MDDMMNTFQTPRDVRAEERSEAARALPVNVIELAEREPVVAATFGFGELRPSSVTELIAWTLSGSVGGGQRRVTIAELCIRVLSDDRSAYDDALRDIEATGLRNEEQPFLAATFLYSRGLHIALGHRIVHSLWRCGRRDAAASLQFLLSAAFATDIHPGARIGGGLWLDHGLGVVIGATSVIGENASIWHRVTLGSTLKDLGGQRHPIVGDGVTIGSGATILGNVRIGNNCVVAAGSVVVGDVPADTTVAGVPAKPKQRGSGSFGGFVSGPTAPPDGPQSSPKEV